MKFIKEYSKKIIKSSLYNPERILIHTKHLLAPQTKKNLIGKPSNYEWIKAYKNFRKEGFAKLPTFLTSKEYDLFKNLDDSQILNLVEKGKLPCMRFGENLNKVNQDSGICYQEIFSDSSLLKKESYWASFEWLVESYLGTKRFWIRNGPMIMSDNKKIKTKKNAVNFYHLDLGMHQLGFIVMLRPTNKNSTCTQIIPRTHREYRLGFEFQQDRSSDEFINYTKKKELQYGSKKLYGDIGTTFIFDAGNMLHRGLEGGNRLMFQINLTCSFTNKSGTSNRTSEKILEAIGKKPSEAFC